MSDRMCVLCRFYRPDVDARYADTVCVADRLRLERDLLAIPSLFQRLTSGELLDGSSERPAADPVAGRVPAGLIPARVHRPTVTGSREAPLPISVDAVDLVGPARTVAALGDPRDQIGYLPVATVLDEWVRYFRRQVRPGFQLPPATVTELVAFLHRNLPAVIEGATADLPAFAAALHSIGAALRRVLGDVEPQPQPLLGVRCRGCRTVSSLVPWPTGEYVECRTCGQLYTMADRIELARQQAREWNGPRMVTVDGRLAEPC